MRKPLISSTREKYRMAPARSQKISSRDNLPNYSGEESKSISLNDHFNIIEILLLDHSYMKDCIDVLKDDEADPKTKIKYAKGFLDALEKHSYSEKKSLYTPLLDVSTLRSRILESSIEHQIIDSKVRKLVKKLKNAKVLNEENSAELKVLAEIVSNHIEEEEDKLFPFMQRDIDSAILNQMGYQFLRLREFTKKDLQNSPDLLEEVQSISKNQIPVKNFRSITHEYFSRDFSQ